MNQPNRTPLLRMTGIVKSYPGVRALKGVDFDLRAGEIHCLIGENGAGKSTLMRVMSGAETPDAGSVEIDGKTYASLSPVLSHALGITVIYQETDLVMPLSVAENIYLGHEKVGRGGVLDRAGMRAEVVRLMQRFNLRFPIDEPVRNLGPAQRQLVQIVKAVSRDSRVVVLDEPTASLTDNEIRHLFELLAVFKAEGIGIVYVSHRLQEIIEIGDRVTIMRDGTKIETHDVKDIDENHLIEAMVGRPLEQTQHAKRASGTGKIVLSTRGLSVAGQFENVDLELRQGEVLGLGGLVGAGRSELLECLFGMSEPAAGEIHVNGARVRFRSPRDAIRAGLGLVPEERRESGLVLGRSVADNIAFPILKQISWLSLLRRSKLRDIATELVKNLRVKTPSLDQVVRTLSGGNQQKIVLAKWLAARSRILLLDEPSRGVDINAKFEIHQLIRSLVDEGVSVIMASSDMLELLSLSDRILVMAEGRAVKVLTADEASQVEVMRYAVPRASQPASQPASQSAAQSAVEHDA
ncbi:sugar ABC transporter ATP-binding protein [Pararobbsia silviterrae]|uniref:Sugar ABC transporter ATP-binding protein n=1 Tax=Pararobbsia silviterrae TaxID=1792498 RepID=A0A494Y6K2_9BURK|nr:sugar ABC transporter ATP-binding protein [Pararobbsia silviterrae]RKP57712.1 sugar ABC transporter ATP-binding protein [Pararobbsia silviterrae]